MWYIRENNAPTASFPRMVVGARFSGNKNGDIYMCMKKIVITESQLNLLLEADKIKCDNCGWSWKRSEGGKDLYVCHKCGHDNDKKSLDTFAEKRFGGAEKIADNAKKKGGVSMLTYHHFEVKLPYYKKAVKGEFDVEAAKMEFESYVKDLSLEMDMIAFQKLVGRIEVLGELIIKNK